MNIFGEVHWLGAIEQPLGFLYPVHGGTPLGMSCVWKPERCEELRLFGVGSSVRSGVRLGTDPFTPSHFLARMRAKCQRRNMGYAYGESFSLFSWMPIFVGGCFT